MGLGVVVGVVLGGLVWWLTRTPAGGVPRGHRAPPPPLGRALRLLLGRRQSWLAAAYCSFISVPMICFVLLWGVAYFVQVLGLERTEASLAATLMLFGWALGAPTFGWFSDRIGRRKAPMLAGSLVAFVLWTVFLAVPGLPLALQLALVFTIGVASSAMPLSFAYAREVNPAGIAGLATPFVNFASILDGAPAQPLVGWLLDLGWSGRMAAGARIFGAQAYADAFLLFPVIALLAVGSALALVETRCRRLDQAVPETG